MSFKERVLEAVRQIPRGETRSYKEVAAKAGSPGAARAVGTIMRNNRDRTVPCHRVVHADGRTGGYNGLAGHKRAILGREGVRIVRGKVKR